MKPKLIFSQLPVLGVGKVAESVRQKDVDAVLMDVCPGGVFGLLKNQARDVGAKNLSGSYHAEVFRTREQGWRRATYDLKPARNTRASLRNTRVSLRNTRVSLRNTWKQKLMR